MKKTSTITIRIEAGLKQKFKGVCEDLGITITEAITMFIHKAIAIQGLPLELNEGKTTREKKLTLGQDDLDNLSEEEIANIIKGTQQEF